jgi:menaquinone-specific isochorismate synthase
VRDFALWHHEGRSLVGRGRVASIEVPVGMSRGTEAWERLVPTLERTEREIAFGSFTFDPEAAGSVLFVPDVVERRWSPPTGTDGVRRPRYVGAAVDEVRWLEDVAQAVKSIDAGELEKVVLARDERLRRDEPFDAEATAARLARAFPGCYTFVCDGLVGATPELLLSKRGPHIEALVLAGSARRGFDEADDQLAGSQLMKSTKERDEHSHAVRSVREPLEDLCDRVEIQATPHLLRLANVQHLASRVVGRLRHELPCLELLDVLHPTAAVGGVPRAAALDRIRAVEGDLRGRYAGPVGWVDARGDGEWGIALRCAHLEGDTATLFAGAGIVAGSLPEEELEETRLKFRAMEAALGL